MHDPTFLLALIPFVGAVLAFDLYRTLKSGRAKTWMNGTATRAHQPARFWRYVYQGYIGLAVCAIAFICVMLRPDWFR